jgi:hypothetical protein
MRHEMKTRSGLRTVQSLALTAMFVTVAAFLVTGTA